MVERAHKVPRSNSQSLRPRAGAGHLTEGSVQQAPHWRHTPSNTQHAPTLVVPHHPQSNHQVANPDATTSIRHDAVGDLVKVIEKQNSELAEMKKVMLKCSENQAAMVAVCKELVGQCVQIREAAANQSRDIIQATNENTTKIVDGLENCMVNGSRVLSSADKSTKEVCYSILILFIPLSSPLTDS